MKLFPLAVILSAPLLASASPARALFGSRSEPPRAEKDPKVLETLLQAEKLYDQGLKELKDQPRLGREKIGQALSLLTSVLDEDRISNSMHQKFIAVLDDLRNKEVGVSPTEPSALDVRETELVEAPSLSSAALATPLKAARSYEIRIDTSNVITQKYLALYTKDGRRDHVLEALERSGRYRKMIETALRDAGLPRELFYLVMVESEFKPKAVSRSGAAGLWQLMPYTARKLGLEVDYWVDERFDPQKATRAAIRYLTDLHEWFGDWHLALASYNRGEGGIGNDLKFSKSTHFDELSDRHALPHETNDYVPKFAACVLIGENPKAFGFEPVYESSPAYDAVTVDKALDLEIAAKAAGTTADALRELNPSVRAWCTPSDRASFELRIPAGTKESFLKNLAEVKDWNPAREWMRYKVARGETIGHIAHKFHTTTARIIDDNRIANPKRLRPGVVLKIRPGRPALASSKKKRKA